MSFQLYRHYDAGGRLLYIGKSANALKRLVQHSGAEWASLIANVKIERMATAAELAQAEVAAILNERPLYNKQFNTASIARRKDGVAPSHADCEQCRRRREQTRNRVRKVRAKK